MKLITAIIKPFKLEEVRQALLDVGVEGLPERRALRGKIISFGLRNI